MNDGAPVPVNADPADNTDELVIISVWLSAQSMGITYGEGWEEGGEPLFGVDFDFPPAEWRFGKLSDFEDQQYKSKLQEYHKKKRNNPDDTHFFPCRDIPGPDRSELNNIMTQIGDELRPLTELYSKMGGIRFDVTPSEGGGCFEERVPRLLIVCKKSDATRLKSCQPEPGDGENSSILNVEIRRGDISRTLKDFRVFVRSFIGDAQLIFDQFTDFDPKQSNRCFGGQSTPDLLPLADETMDEWGQRVALSTDDIDKILRYWERADRKMGPFMALYRGRKPPRQDFLVPGLIPPGKVTMLAGEGGVGKSTLLTELAAKVADTSRNQWEFLGTSVSSGGKAIYFTAEESGADIHSRLLKFAPDLPVFVYDDPSATLEQCAEWANEIENVSLIIFDPLLRFLGDDEDSSVKTGSALGKLHEIARTHNCAVVVVHHVRKSSNSSWLGFRSRIRGSSALVDQARSVIGMMNRPGDVSELAIVKSNLLPADMAWGKVNEPRRFYRNEDTLTLDPVPSSGSNKVLAPGNNEPGDIDDLVLAEISRMSEVRRTGNKSVYTNRGAALEGASRAKIEGCVDSLVDCGRAVDNDGIISVAG